MLAREVAHAHRGSFVLGIADRISRFAQALYIGPGLAALNIFRCMTGDEHVAWLTVALLVLAPALMTLLQSRFLRRARSTPTPRRRC